MNRKKMLALAMGIGLVSSGSNVHAFSVPDGMTAVLLLNLMRLYKTPEGEMGNLKLIDPKASLAERFTPDDTSGFLKSTIEEIVFHVMFQPVVHVAKAGGDVVIGGLDSIGRGCINNEWTTMLVPRSVKHARLNGEEERLEKDKAKYIALLAEQQDDAGKTRVQGKIAEMNKKIMAIVDRRNNLE